MFLGVFGCFGYLKIFWKRFREVFEKVVTGFRG